MVGIVVQVSRITNPFGKILYLQYFKFSPSIRGVFSLKDELVEDNDPKSPWTGNIEKMSTRGIFLNLSFH